MNDHDLITTMRESFTGVRSATPLGQIVSRSRAIRVRRRIPGAVTVAAVAAAAGAAVALIPSAPVRPAPAATQTTAYVVDRVTRALDSMPGSTVVVMRWASVPASRSFTRTDYDGQHRLEMFTLAGQPVSDSGSYSGHSAGRLTVMHVYIDYRNKTWWRAVLHIADAKPAPATVWTCRNAESDSIDRNSREMAAQLRTALSCGELKVAGRGTVDGVPAVELSGEFQGVKAMTYWVNATTYLPVRFTSRFSGGPAQQVNVQWLPPTAANVAQVNVPVPAGFSQVPPPGNASSS